MVFNRTRTCIGNVRTNAMACKYPSGIRSWLKARTKHPFVFFDVDMLTMSIHMLHSVFVARTHLQREQIIDHPHARLHDHHSKYHRYKRSPRPPGRQTSIPQDLKTSVRPPTSRLDHDTSIYTTNDRCVLSVRCFLPLFLQIYLAP